MMAFVEALIKEAEKHWTQAAVWREIAHAALDVAAEHHKTILRQRETIANLREAHRALRSRERAA
jgi:hypothetical protein